ncbi:MAG TPA: hypothetical protein DIU15_18275 [Deltaproteobacteria bacterium]|nr:hypothetical protein [Deltaproteobacteria bacterium]HCP47993.1 hypothetical protein [Deltaproteobacteria bacterium]
MGTRWSIRPFQLFHLVGVAVLLGSWSSAVLADEVCVARDDAPFVAVSPGLVGASSAPLGRLHKRNCYTVMGRDGDRTRLWLRSSDGFQGEVEVDETVLAHVLVDDVALRIAPDEEPFGKILSGAVVVLEPIPGSELSLARTLEGRVELRFLVSVDDVFPAQEWPAPDPDDDPGSGWPEGTRLPPPEAIKLLDGRASTDVRALIREPLFSVADLRQDPAMGQLSYVLLDQEDDAAHVRIVSPTYWIDGWIPAASSWAVDPPARGWDPLQGKPAAAGAAPLPREVGPKGAALSLEPKGDSVGELRPGARVRVVGTQGGWVEVSCAFEAGEARGWIEKKRLVREGKESTAAVAIERIASVHVDKAVATWVNPEGHSKPGEGEGAEPIPIAPEIDLEPIYSHLFDGLQAMRWAYADQARSGDLGGDITVRLVIDPKGSVTETTVPVDKLGNDVLRGMVLQQVEGLEFSARKVPRRRRGEPELDWTIQLWLQFVFNSVGS